MYRDLEKLCLEAQFSLWGLEAQYCIGVNPLDPT
jgi:hypothetical protein